MGIKHKTVTQMFGGMGIFAGYKELLMSGANKSIDALQVQMLQEKFFTYKQLSEITGYSRSSVMKKLQNHPKDIMYTVLNENRYYQKCEELTSFVQMNTKRHKVPTRDVS